MSKAKMILESLKKRRSTLSEAWNIPSDLRDKDQIKKALDRFKAKIGVRTSNSPELEDLSNFIDYKSKKLSVDEIRSQLRTNTKSAGFILETPEETVLCVIGFGILLINDNGFNFLNEKEAEKYTGRSAKNTKGYAIINPSYSVADKEKDTGDVLNRDFNRYSDDLSTILYNKDRFLKLSISEKPSAKELEKFLKTVEKESKKGIGLELSIGSNKVYVVFRLNIDSKYKSYFEKSAVLDFNDLEDDDVSKRLADKGKVLLASISNYIDAKTLKRADGGDGYSSSGAKIFFIYNKDKTFEIQFNAKGWKARGESNSSKSKASRILESLKVKRKTLSEAHLSLKEEFIDLYNKKDVEATKAYFLPLLEERFKICLEKVFNPGLREEGYLDSSDLYDFGNRLTQIQALIQSIKEYHLAKSEEDKKTISIRIEDKLEELQRSDAYRISSNLR